MFTMLVRTFVLLITATAALAAPAAHRHWPRFTVPQQHFEVLSMRAQAEVNPAAVLEATCIDRNAYVNPMFSRSPGSLQALPALSLLNFSPWIMRLYRQKTDTHSAVSSSMTPTAQNSPSAAVSLALSPPAKATRPQLSASRAPRASLSSLPLLAPRSTSPRTSGSNASAPLVTSALPAACAPSASGVRHMVTSSSPLRACLLRLSCKRISAHS